MYRIIISFLLIISFLPSFSDDWVTVDFGPSATIDLPGTPKDTVMNGEEYYSYGDSVESYHYYSGPYVLSYETLKQFYTNYTLTVLEYQGGQLWSHKDIYIDGIEAWEIKYLTRKDHHTYVNQMRFLIYKGTLYCFYHTFLRDQGFLSYDTNKYFDAFNLKHSYNYNGWNRTGPQKASTLFLVCYFGFLAFLVLAPVAAILFMIIFKRKKIF